MPHLPYPLLVFSNAVCVKLQGTVSFCGIIRAQDNFLPRVHSWTWNENASLCGCWKRSDLGLTFEVVTSKKKCLLLPTRRTVERKQFEKPHFIKAGSFQWKTANEADIYTGTAIA